MNEAELRQELTALRKENKKLKQELTVVKAELREWEHNAILLMPEEIFAISKAYRERKAKERAAKDKVAMAEIDKLMVSITQYKGGYGDDERV